MENRTSSAAYFSEDTIAALVTALGGAISVIRVSGPGTFSTLKQLSGSSAAAASEPRRFHRIALKDSTGNPLDDALYVRFVAPESYTGEDVVEFHLHGSSFIASRLMESLGSLGIRQALPGEFSFRAVRNGKLSLPQAEAVADLIAASNDGAVALALEKLGGTQNRWVGAIAEDLRQLAMDAEIGIDFSDQEIDELGLAALKARLAPLFQKLRDLEAGYQRGLRVQEGVRVVFAGLPNAGKSSFFNALLGEDRSIVSAQAGTTRDLVHEHLNLRGMHGTVTLRLQDTAGLRSSADEIEKEGIDRSRRAAAQADLILFLVDSAELMRNPNELIAAVREQWAQLGSPSSRTIGILTKTDLAPASAAPNSLDGLGIQTWIRTSAPTGAGIHEAVRAITAFCETWTHRRKGEVLLTRLDQKEAVSAAMTHLSRAQTAADPALFASDLRHALNAMALLIGETLPDDILGQIFSRFCIGK